MMNKNLYDVLSILSSTPSESYATLQGSSAFPAIHGTVRFYSLGQGTLVSADVSGLPFGLKPCEERIFGFHIHEGSRCLGDENDPFAQTKGHYNPHSCSHPQHAGDLPPLFGNDGYALQIFYTNRFLPEEIVGRTVVIHDMPDDFKTQPSGNSGMKIACGEIKANKMPSEY